MVNDRPPSTSAHVEFLVSLRIKRLGTGTCFAFALLRKTFKGDGHAETIRTACRIHDPPRRGRRTSGSCANPFLTANRPRSRPSTKRLSFTEHRALDTSGKTATTHGMAANIAGCQEAGSPRPTDTTGPRLSGIPAKRGKAGIAIVIWNPYRNRNGRRDDRWNRDRDDRRDWDRDRRR